MTAYLDSDSEDEMPSGWEERTTDDGLVFYVNHEQKSTQWTHPRSGKRKRLTGCLPVGWEQIKDDNGQTCFRHLASGRTTYTDPRLAFAVEDFSNKRPPEAPNSRFHRRRFDAFTRARQVMQGIDMTGKYVVITGGTSGVGLECMKWLLAHKAHVTCLCRHPLTPDQCAQHFGGQVNFESELHFITCDLESLWSVRRAVIEYERLGWPIHHLICVAGVFSPGHSLTVDGFERTFQINCLSHIYLIRMFRQQLINSRPARIILVTSESHRFLDQPINSTNDVSPERLSVTSNKDYWCWQSYNLSKLCLLWATAVLNPRLRVRGVTVVAAHPGSMLNTCLMRDSWLYSGINLVFRPFTKDVEQACASVLHAAVCDDLHDMGGGYYINNCWLGQPSDEACAIQLQNRFWQVVVNMLNDFQQRHGIHQQDILLEFPEPDVAPPISPETKTVMPI